MANKPSVIIIGAGIAGLSAAEILTSSGYEDVKILEGRNRIGGRVCVREHDENTIHMGAQWIHQYCSENPMAQVARK
jgi:monoamine oxidase